MTVLVKVKAGHTIPDAFQNKFLEQCPHGFSFSVANKTEGMKSLFYNPLPQGNKKGYDLAKSLAEVSNKFKEKNYVLVGYEYDISEEERQPFPILVDDKDVELLHAFVAGDMTRYMDENKPVGPETQFVDAYFGGLLIDAYTEAGADLSKMMENIHKADFRKGMIEHMEPKCTIMLLTKDDDFLRYKRKNEEYAEFTWGETSTALGYKEEAPPVESKEATSASDDNIPAWRKARLSAAAAPAAEPPPAKPTQPADEDEKEEAGEVDDTKSDGDEGEEVPAETLTKWAELAKGLDPKDGIYKGDGKIYPPPHLGGRELRRGFYGAHGIGGTGSFNHKARAGIPIDKLQPGSHLYRLFNGIPEKAPPKQERGKDTSTSVVQTKDTLPAANKPQPLMTADQIEKTKKVVSSAFASDPIDASQIQAIESKYPKFSERLDVKFEEMILWPQDRMWDVVQTGHKQAWMLILELQARVLKDNPDLIPKAVAKVEEKEEEDDNIPAWRKAKMKSKVA